jgi:energy-coupling factor transporter ATP-binding protein EcfA2
VDTEQVDWRALRAEVANVFTPAAPIQTREFFYGRITQLEAISETIDEAGRHAIVYGERGVGKTSMSNILGQLFPQLLVVRVAADSSDSFTSLWRKVFRRIKVIHERREPGFGGGVRTDEVPLSEIIDAEDLDRTRWSAQVTR